VSAPTHRNWIAVASAEHVQRGHDAGFMQVCHGKAAPLRRVLPGDHVIYYSPTRAFRGGDKLQAFTAIGIVHAGEPYQVDMGDGFRPFRRNVTWFSAREAPIAPLLNALEFTAGKTNWGGALRFGLLVVSNHDFTCVAAAMDVAATLDRAGKMEVCR
jgi:hypothetical protein